MNKVIAFTALFSVFVIFHTTTFCQNVQLNILAQDNGIVKKGSNLFIEVTICNTDHDSTVGAYRLKPQLSISSEGIIQIEDTGHILPAGWKVTFNSGTSLRLSNGTSELKPKNCQNILIRVKGNNRGGPSLITANMLFSNGIAPGTAPDGSLKRDIPADNYSTTACTVL